MVLRGFIQIDSDGTP